MYARHSSQTTSWCAALHVLPFWVTWEIQCQWVSEIAALRGTGL